MATAKGDTRKGKVAKPKKPTTFLLAQPSRADKIRKHFMGALVPASRDYSQTGNYLGSASNPPRSSSSSSVRSSGSSAARPSPSVGGSGGVTNSLKHNPNTGKPGNGNRRGGRGGRGGGAGGGYFGGPGGGKYLKQARKYVNSDVKKQMEILRNEIDARRNDMQFANNQAGSMYNRAEGDLRHIFGEANEQNQLQTKAILDRLTGQQGATQQIYGDLIAQQQGNTQQNQADLMGELGRLGIQQGANLGQFNADATFAQNMAAQNQANTQANLGAMSQSAGNIGSLISQMANSSLASNLGKQLNLRNQTKATNRQNFLSQKDEVRDAMRTERMGKGTRIWDMFRQLEDQGYNRWFQNREANRANALGWSNFNLSADGQNADIMFQKAQMLADQRAAAAERRAIQNQMRNLGGGNNNGRNALGFSLSDIFG